MLSRQVSWLAGQCCCPAFPKPIAVSVTLLDSGSPLTVAGAAPALASRRTGFPLSFGPNEPEEPRRIQLRSTAISVNNLPPRYAFGDDGPDDRGVERLVIVQPDRCVEFGACLHLVEQFVSTAVALDGGEQMLLCPVGDA